MTAKSEHIYATIGASVAAATVALIRDGALPDGVDQSRVTVEPTRDSAHGDMATNAAMVLAKPASKNPKQLAELIAEKLRTDSLIERAEVAGPGFINLVLKPAAWIGSLRQILEQGASYGRSAIGEGEKINVEYVSANPTGPMHIGHCRGAVFGDALASLLTFSGYDVTREYYINDAGAQVDMLARSAYLRYREALGEAIGDIPEGLYPGDYLKPVGVAIAAECGSALLGKSELDWLPIVRQFAIELMLRQILLDLERLEIAFDTFFSERALLSGALRFFPPNQRPEFYFAKDSYDLTRKGPMGIRAALARQHLMQTDTEDTTFTVEKAPGSLGESGYLPVIIDDLRKRGLVYQGRLPRPKGPVDEDWEDREQTLFRTTDFGDDVDRPLLKSDGSFTYFASDIAYHKNKFDRGFRNLIDVWGADHGGYIKRVAAAVAAVTDRQAVLDVKLIQLVKLLRGGEPVKMSKRAGEFVTLREVVDEVGPDAVRFMMLFRKNDSVLDFDLAKVVEQSRDNPVFYVQYAHARCRSVLRNAAAAVPGLPSEAATRASFLARARFERLADPAEFALIRQLALFPRLIEQAALAHEPHRIAFYLFDLASEFHGFWTRGTDMPHLRFIIENDTELTIARLALVQGVVSVLASGLAVLGVSAPEEMR